MGFTIYLDNLYFKMTYQLEDKGGMLSRQETYEEIKLISGWVAFDSVTQFALYAVFHFCFMN